jgi:hypothetical protein
MITFTLNKGYILKENIWESVEGYNNIYKIDLSNTSAFYGITSGDFYNIGFFETADSVIHGGKKSSLSGLENDYDFYCDGEKYIYVKLSYNPINTKFDEIKFAPHNNLVMLQSSNITIDGLDIEYTGGYGIKKKDLHEYMKNITITNCVIQKIGGSYYRNTSRYGNGIEFHDQTDNTSVTKCIFKDIYDAGYSLQGSNVIGGYHNNTCKDNIFINCTYPIEFFAYRVDRENRNTFSVNDISFKNNVVENNIIINQGRGWGYEYRGNTPFQTADLVIWLLPSNKNGLKYRNNISFNSRALYYRKKYEKNKFDDLQYSNLLDADDNLFYINNLKKIDSSSKLSDKEDNTSIIKTVNQSCRYRVTKYNKKESCNSRSFKKQSLIDLKMDINSKFYVLTESNIKLIDNKELINSNDYARIKEYYINLAKNSFKNNEQFK